MFEKSKSLKERIIELRSVGSTVDEISKKLNCSKGTISYHLNKNGLGGYLKNENFINDITSDVIEQIKILRIDGKKNYDEIRREIGISEDKLKKICRLLKLNKSNTRFKIYINLKKTEVEQKYLELNSLRKTADYFNVTRETIRKFISDDLVNINKKNKHKKNKSKAVIDWRKRTKIKLVEYKGGKCENCGYNKYIEALQFHHINSSEKDFNIGARSYSFERLKNEVDKCMLVCANCHIELHTEMKKSA